MSFRTAREEGSEEFSISGFRPAGDAFDGIKKQTSLPVVSQHQQVSHATPPSSRSPSCCFCD